MVFTDNTAPYHITQPSTDNDVQIISPTTTMVNLTCSLNVTIPSSVTVSWDRINSQVIISNDRVKRTSHGTMLVIENPQPSDVGVYQCKFINVADRWILKRNITLITGTTVY